MIGDKETPSGLTCAKVAVPLNISLEKMITGHYHHNISSHLLTVYFSG